MREREPAQPMLLSCKERVGNTKAFLELLLKNATHLGVIPSDFSGCILELKIFRYVSLGYYSPSSSNNAVEQSDLRPGKQGQLKLSKGFRHDLERFTINENVVVVIGFQSTKLHT